MAGTSRSWQTLEKCYVRHPPSPSEAISRPLPGTSKAPHCRPEHFKHFNFKSIDITCSNSPHKNLSFLPRTQRRGKTHGSSSCGLRRAFVRTRMFYFYVGLSKSVDDIPDVTNMSWQLSLSITGTETWCRMFGTPPPDVIIHI